VGPLGKDRGDPSPMNPTSIFEHAPAATSSVDSIKVNFAQYQRFRRRWRTISRTRTRGPRVKEEKSNET
jgi:hypothetical protein